MGKDQEKIARGEQGHAAACGPQPGTDRDKPECWNPAVEGRRELTTGPKKG